MDETQAHRIRRRRSREEADRLVLEYEQSGLTRRIYCRQHGLSLATLDSYRRRRSCGSGQAKDAAPATAIASAVTFVPVELVERSPLHRRPADSAASLHIELANGRRICVSCGF